MANEEHSINFEIFDGKKTTVNFSKQAIPISISEAQKQLFYYCHILWIDFMVSAEELAKFIDLFGRAVHEKLSDISAQDFLSFIPNTGFRFFNMIHSM